MDSYSTNDYSILILVNGSIRCILVSRVFYIYFSTRLFRNLPVRKEAEIEDVTETTPAAAVEGGGEAPMES